MRKMSRFLSVFLAALTLVMLLGFFPGRVQAAEVLEAPTVKVSNKASSGKPTLSWEPVEGAAKYQVYRSEAKDGPYKRLTTTAKTSTTNSGAVAGKTYYYYVVAVDADGSKSQPSNTVKRVCDLARPTVKLSNRASDGKIVIQWDAVEGATKYQLYRSETKDGTYKRLTTTTKTKVNNTSAAAGKTYYYKVRAVCDVSAAASAYSTPKYRTCDLARPAVTATLGDFDKPQLTWKAIEGAEKYQVYRATSKNGEYTWYANTAETGFLDTGATSGTTWYYKVKAIHANSAGNSALSAADSVTTPPAEAGSGCYYTVANSVTLYKSASSSSSSIRIPYMSEVKSDVALPAASSKWCKVTYQGNSYYVWIAKGSDKFTDQHSGFSYTGSTRYQQEVLDLAMKIYREWDTVYAHDQSNGIPNSNGTYGFDCSGLASYVINTVMQQHVPTYRLSANLTKLYKTGNIYNQDLPGELNAVKVSKNDLQPGDVLFFETDGTLAHCGIYLGSGEFIHSTTTWNGVAISPLAGSYEERYIGARRYLPDTVKAANTRMYLTSGVKVYEDRSGEGDFLCRLSKGTAVTVLYMKSDFTAYIRAADGTCGFVWAKYLSKTK